MEVYTIGFTKKTAREFFGTLRQAGIRRLIDVRLNNVTQLAGFTKRDDLAFFLDELCGIEYRHEPLLAPTQEILTGYRKKVIDWDEYARRFLALLSERQVERCIDKSLFDGPTVLLCSEPTAKRCHRRLVLEYLDRQWGDVRAVHL